MKNLESKKRELFSEYPDVMDVHQLREALGIGRKAVYKLLDEKKISCFKIGHTYKIPKSALIEYVNQSCKRGDSK